ncbi:hypothetical protein [Pseudonocardia zijingensis]|uniref:Uncharacterized protein n=1 Tax=Pseudonocardia zijingensis TaxID=153376 RepID=A0ABN1Q1V6_9PSEU
MDESLVVTDHLPVIAPVPPPAGDRRQQRLDARPGFVGQLAVTHPDMINFRRSRSYSVEGRFQFVVLRTD